MEIPKKSVTLDIPENVVEASQIIGIWKKEILEGLLEAELRRRGREILKPGLDKLWSSTTPFMTEEEIDELVRTVQRERQEALEKELAEYHATGN